MLARHGGEPKDGDWLVFEISVKQALEKREQAAVDPRLNQVRVTGLGSDRDDRMLFEKRDE